MKPEDRFVERLRALLPALGPVLLRPRRRRGRRRAARPARSPPRRTCSSRASTSCAARTPSASAGAPLPSTSRTSRRWAPRPSSSCSRSAFRRRAARTFRSRSRAARSRAAASSARALVGRRPLGGADQTVVAVALWGRPAGAPLTRSGARPGDAVYLSGHPGQAAAGLRLARSSRRSPSRARRRRRASPSCSPAGPGAPRRVSRPGAARRARAALAREGAGDRRDRRVRRPRRGRRPAGGRLRAPGSCSRRDALPAVAGAARASREMESARPASSWLLSGGDDYELLFTVPGRRTRRARGAPADLGVPVTRVGRVEEGRGAVLRDGATRARRRGARLRPLRRPGVSLATRRAPARDDATPKRPRAVAGSAAGRRSLRSCSTDGPRRSPERVAAAVALGVGVGLSPFIGFHFILAIVLAFLFRLNKLDTVLGSFVGNPWTLPPFFALGYRPGTLGPRLRAGERAAASSGNASCTTTSGSAFRGPGSARGSSSFLVGTTLLAVARRPGHVPDAARALLKLYHRRHPRVAARARATARAAGLRPPPARGSDDASRRRESTDRGSALEARRALSRSAGAYRGDCGAATSRTCASASSRRPAAASHSAYPRRDGREPGSIASARRHAKSAPGRPSAERSSASRYASGSDWGCARSPSRYASLGAAAIAPVLPREAEAEVAVLVRRERSRAPPRRTSPRRARLPERRAPCRRLPAQASQ